MKEHFSFPPKNVRKYYFKEFSLRNKVKKEKNPFTHFPHLSIENNNIFLFKKLKLTYFIHFSNSLFCLGFAGVPGMLTCT